MNKTIILGLITMLFAVSFVSAIDFEINYTISKGYQSGSSTIQVSQLKYEPYPVNPGEYFTLWIKAENTGSELTENAVFELIPKYPFSLDANEDPVREYGKLGAEEPVVLEYKIRVDKDAVDGTNEIELRYNTEADENSWIYKEFDIEVDDAQTDFDLVIQETNENEVSIAIANTGKNVAYSIIVRIPEQEYFEAVGTNGQMVGNLENGDYTLVGFEIAKKGRSSGNKLKVQIDYTDNIGERRSLIKELSFNTGSSIVNNSNRTLPEGMTREDFIAQRRATFQQEQSIYQKWWFWTIAIVVLLAGWKVYKIHNKRKEEKEERKHKK